MLRRKLRKNSLPKIDINIVSLMDIMTTIIFFLIFMAGFSKFSILSAYSQPVGSGKDLEKKPKFTVSLEIAKPTKVRLNLGPMAGLKIVESDQFFSYLNQNFTGNQTSGYNRLLEARTEDELAVKIQSALIEIKKGFPHEETIRLVVADGITYQSVIHFMEVVREVPEGREPLHLKNLINQRKETRMIFPEISVSALSDEG